jgi:hypothetical protein
VLWFLLWTVLVLGAGLLFGLIGRSLWRKGLALFWEVGAAAERLSAATEPPDDRTPAEPAQLGVFADLEEIRRERAAGRARARGKGRRRADVLPPLQHTPTPARLPRTPGPPPTG